MKKHPKFLVGLSAAALAFCGAFAAASLSSSMKAPEETTVTATWHLGEKTFEGAADEISHPDIITASSLSSEGVTTNRVRTAHPASGDIKLTSWNTSMSATRVETDYVQFSITTAEPFKPTSLTLNAGQIKTGNVRMDIIAQVEDATYTISEGIVAARTNESATDDADIDYSLSYDLTEVPAVTGEFALKFYIYGDASKEREIGFSDVCISGIYTTESEEPENPEPENPEEPDDPIVDDGYFFHIPGTLPVPETKDEVNYGWGGRMDIEGSEGDKNFCNAYEGATLTFNNVHVHQTGGYNVLLPLDYATNNGAQVKIEVTDVATKALEAYYTVVSPENNSKWEKLEYTLKGVITEGVKEIKFSFTPGTDRNWACNMKAPEFVCTGEGTPLDPSEVPDGWMSIPGTIDIDHPCWKYDGLRIENNGANIGYAQDGYSGTGEVFVKEAGVYSMHMNFNWFKNACDFEIEIIDQATNIKEVDTYYHISGVHETDILLEGNLTVGKKTIKYTFHSEAGGYLANYTDHEVTKVGESFAAIKTLTAEGIEPTETEGYDYSYNIPIDYKDKTVKLKADLIGATLKVKEGETEIPVSEEGVFELPVPVANQASEAVLTLIPDAGAFAGKTEHKLRLFHIGGVILTGLNVDGIEIDEETVASIQENKTGVNIDGYVFTSLPKVEATFIDGNVVEAEGVLADDQTTATYTFKGVAGDLAEDYSLTLSGFHIYQPSENDQTEVLKYDAAYKGETSWDNGLFSISCNDGWDGSQFKMKANPPVTLTTPSYMKIKQIKMACLRDNYVPGKVASVTSEGATIYLPSASSFQTGVDNDHSLNLLINVENHTPGTPFVITFEGGSQPVAWFEFIYESLFVATTDITLNETAAAIRVGETLNLEATVLPENATDKSVAWETLNPEIATVDANGVVTAVGIGTTTIIAKSGGFSAECTVKSYPLTGDADWSGSVTINDAIHIANYIIENVQAKDGWEEEAWLEFYTKAADANGDNSISISDASATVEMALENTTEKPQGAKGVSPLNEPTDNLVIGGLTTSADGGSSVAVTLDNTIDYVALQADIYLPEGVSFEVKPGSSIASTHTFQYHRFDDSHMRVAIYNFGGRVIATGNEPLFEIVADANLSDASDIALARILASDPDANEYVLGAKAADTTGVAGLGIDGNVAVKVFDLNGRYVSDSVEGLETGIYIVVREGKAKKVFVR